MAENKVLKGINFPGLEGTYYVPEATAVEDENGYIEIKSYVSDTIEIENLDATLTKEGYAADAAAVGTALAGKAPAGYVETTTVCATDTEINEALQTMYDATSDNAIKYFNLYVNATGLALSGGNWNLAIYRTNASYGFVEAKSYNPSANAVKSYTRQLINATWGEWVAETSSVSVDTTLSVSGAAADAAAVGTALAGKAPAGYGLGGSSPGITFEELDNTKKNGWYSFWNSNTTLCGITFTAAHLFVAAYDANACRQILYPVLTNNTVLTRECYGGTWGDWVNVSPSTFAPAGYGLNNNFKTTSNPSDVDGYQTTGWYRYVMNSSGVPLDSGLGINYALIRVDSYSSGSYVVQTMYTINYPGRSWQRYYYNGSWSGWVENTSGSKATTIYSGSLSSGSVDISSYSNCVAYIVSGATVDTYARVSVVIPKAALGTTYQLYSDGSYIVLKTSTSAITIGAKGATSAIVTSVVGIY